MEKHHEPVIECPACEGDASIETDYHGDVVGWRCDTCGGLVERLRANRRAFNVESITERVEIDLDRLQEKVRRVRGTGSRRLAKRNGKTLVMKEPRQKGPQFGGNPGEGGGKSPRDPGGGPS